VKSNVIDMRTKEKISYENPRNTLPGGIFMSMNDLMLASSVNGKRSYLNNELEDFSNAINIPIKDLRTLIFIFDSRNSKSFLVNHLKDKAGDIFLQQVMFD
jgi:hypothetical protein